VLPGDREMRMRIADILHHKGSRVFFIAPTETLAQAVRILADRLIGALVVCDDFGRLQGVLAERDVIRMLALHGPAALAMKVQQAVPADTPTCTSLDTVKEVMALITVRRVRHLPVVDGGQIVGVVSIGDVLKSRLQEKSEEVEIYRDLSIARV
jgi:CBS domain-containing protein